MKKNASYYLALAFTTSILLGAGQQPSTFAAHTKDERTLVIPKAHQNMGTVYYAITNRDRQVYVESNAPLEDIKGQSNRVIGYGVSSSSTPGSLAAGEWHLPVESIRTGIELRDEHLASEAWLDAKSNPNVIFTLKETQDLNEVKKTNAFASYTATLVGKLTLNGVTHDIEIPDATITILKAGDATKKVANGDLMAIRSKFTVALKDYGVDNPIIGEKVAKNVSLDVSLYLSTLPPAEQ